MSDPQSIGQVVPFDAQAANAAVRAERRPPDPEPAARPRGGRPPSVPAKYAGTLADLGDQTAAVRAAEDWLRRVREDRDDDRGLLLLGKVGRGKSAIAGALATEAGAPVHTQFWPVVDLLAELRREIDQPSDRAPVKDRIRRRRLLVLDDLGAEKATDWTVGQVTEVVSSAYDDRRLLVATSNLTVEQLAGHLGERTVSRLREMTDLVVVDGPDRRMR